MSEREKIIIELDKLVEHASYADCEAFYNWHLAEVARIVAATKIDTLESIMVRGYPAYLINDFDDMPIEYKTFGMVLKKRIDEIKRANGGE